MGRHKDAMIEAESYVFEETPVTFVCPKCGEESDGSAEIPKIHQEFINEIDTDIHVQCIWCNEYFDATVLLGSSECSIKLDDYPETNVDFEPVYFSSYDDDDFWYDDWLEEQHYYQYSEEPQPVFQRSYDDVAALLKSHGSDVGHDPVNRMIFAQCFSMYEAYLCDAFLYFVFLEESNQNTFLNKHDEIKKEVVSVSELASHRELTADKIVRAKITHTIKQTLFHNLPKAVALYRIFGLELFDDEGTKNDLFKAVPLRHDCVHRNGYDIEGNRLDVYTKAYVQKIADAMKSSVSCIEKSIGEKMAEKLGI